MDTVYKYCGKYGADVLCSLELKVTPPNQFNDPFEFTPEVIFSDPASFRKMPELLNDTQYLKRLHRNEGNALDFAKFQELASAKEPEIIKLVVKEIINYCPKFAIEMLDMASNKVAVLCLSQKRDSILMWGHYCDNSRGLVIGFDRSSDCFQEATELRSRLRPVKYVKKRTLLDLSWQEGTPEWNNYLDEVVFRKGEDWSYEEELRQCFLLPTLTQKRLKDGTLGYFLPFPAGAVASVTLSPRCSADLEGAVRSILRDPRLAHVKLDRAILNESGFAIGFEILK